MIFVNIYVPNLEDPVVFADLEHGLNELGNIANYDHAPVTLCVPLFSESDGSPKWRLKLKDADFRDQMKIQIENFKIDKIYPQHPPWK